MVIGDPQANIIDFECAIEIVTPNTKEIWQVKHRRGQEERTTLAKSLVHIPHPGWTTLHVQLVRVVPTNKRMWDTDNLVYAFKVVRDTLARWLGYTDAPDSPITWVYAQHRSEVCDTPHIRIRIAPKALVLGQGEIEARVYGPRPPPHEVYDFKRPRYVQGPKVVPELKGGTPTRQLAIHHRGNRAKSRICASLVRSHDMTYVRVAVHWTDRFGDMWRSSGIAVRLEELRDLAHTLDELALGVGVPPHPRGVISLGAERPGGTDTPSDDVNMDLNNVLDILGDANIPLNYRSPRPKTMNNKKINEFIIRADKLEDRIFVRIDRDYARDEEAQRDPERAERHITPERAITPTGDPAAWSEDEEKE